MYVRCSTLWVLTALVFCLMRFLPIYVCQPLTAIPDGLCEMDALRIMQERSQQDAGALCFIGAGAYEHHIPAAVWDVVASWRIYDRLYALSTEASRHVTSHL